MSEARLWELTAADAARLIRERKVSPVELVQALLDRAGAVDGQVRAWETLDAEGALAAARRAEHALARTDAAEGPLFGVPFAAKDIFDTAGVRTAASFAPYDRRVPTADAESVARLKRAGAILLGKTVTTQFAYADPPRTRNPWAADRTPGGSSSGSGAGVAAREMPMALGSQTAGSVLRPAAYNGVIGFKPSYGRVSKRGVLPLAWSLDHVGVLTRSVEDCELFLTASAGHDPADPDSANVALPPEGRPDPAPPGRIGLLTDALAISAPELRSHVQDVARRFAATGARVQEVTLGEDLETVLAVHHVTMQTEAAAVHADLVQRHRDAYGPRLGAYVEVGRLVPGVAYLHAQRLRRRFVERLDALIADVDVLLLPTAVGVAPSSETTGDPRLQAPFSLAGLPSISLPSGLSAERLPLAIQLVGARWQEPALLRVASWAEALLGPMPAPPL